MTCDQCGVELNDGTFNGEPCTIYLEGGSETVCIGCFEEMGGYEQTEGGEQ